MDQPTFGEELRGQRGLSLKKFAKLVHYDAGYLSKIENGHKPPTDALATRCDAALQTDGRLARLAGAELSRLVASLAWDVGSYSEAQRYYVLAVQMAYVARDSGYAALALADLARQSIDLHDFCRELAPYRGTVAAHDFSEYLRYLSN